MPPQVITPPASHQAERLHALDAIRALALLIGIVFHGLLSLVSFLPPMAWVVRDATGSPLLDAFCYAAHIFRMPAFFLIAGFFAHLLYHRQGPRGFMRHRYQRLVLPLLLALPFVRVALVMLWMWGYQRMGYLAHDAQKAHLSYWQLVGETLFSPKQFQHGEFPWGHLWFLYVLILFCGGVWLLRPVVDRWLDPAGGLRARLDRGLAFLMQRWWGSLALGLATIGPMQGMQGLFGVDTPDRTLLPGFAFLLYGLYFLLGWLLHRQSRLLAEFPRYWRGNLLMSIGLTTGLLAVAIVAASRISPINPEGFRPLIMAFYKGAYGLAAMTGMFAFLGWGMRYLARPSRPLRYLADASYWMYLVHLPVVAVFQILVAPYAWPWPVKVVAILLPSLLLLGLSYQYGVRHTWLGALLNGRRVAAEDAPGKQVRTADTGYITA
jgi:peptidoglycan/LPS O-acetylase OafA/YrhL